MPLLITRFYTFFFCCCNFLDVSAGHLVAVHRGLYLSQAIGRAVPSGSPPAARTESQLPPRAVGLRALHGTYAKVNALFIVSALMCVLNVYIDDGVRPAQSLLSISVI